MPHLCGSLQSVLVNGSERAKVRPGVEVEVHPELSMYVESWKIGYWQNSVENTLIEVTDKTQHELPVNQISACRSKNFVPGRYR